MKNLYLLPTDKPSRLVKLNIFGKDKLHLYKDILPIQDEEQYQNIYITSSENIKEGDWMYYKHFGEDIVTKYNTWGGQNTNVNEHKDYYKKIILTTDVDLIKDGVQPIDDDFLEWFVVHPSCEEVKVKKEFDEDWDEGSGAYGIDYYKIIIPKEESKLDLNFLSDSLDTALKNETKESLTEWLESGRKETTLEEAAEINCESITHPYRDREKAMFIKGAKSHEAKEYWQKGMYSEEEVRLILRDLSADLYEIYPLDSLEQWFEQFKKK